MTRQIVSYHRRYMAGPWFIRFHGPDGGEVGDYAYISTAKRAVRTGAAQRKLAEQRKNSSQEKP